MSAFTLHFFFFFFNDPATTEIYTLSLHDALPIWSRPRCRERGPSPAGGTRRRVPRAVSSASASRATRSTPDRKSTRLNSSHGYISYAVFCLKKKKNNRILNHRLQLSRTSPKHPPL